MSTRVIVKQPKLIKHVLQLLFAADVQLPQHRFQRTKQSLDSAVLPRRMHIRGLFLNTDESKKRLKHKRVKNDFIVRA